MGGDELIQFEEGHYDELVEEFIEKNRDAFEDFVAMKYDGYVADQIDHAKEVGGDRPITQADRDDHCAGDNDG